MTFAWSPGTIPGFQGPDHADSQPQDELQEGPLRWGSFYGAGEPSLGELAQDDVNFVELARSTDDFNGAQLKVRGPRRSQKRWDFTQKNWGFQQKLRRENMGLHHQKLWFNRINLTNMDLFNMM